MGINLTLALFRRKLELIKIPRLTVHDKVKQHEVSFRNSF